MRKKFLLMLTLLILALGGGNLFAQVAKVGNTEYATIDEAIDNWTNGTTLTLLADVTLSDVIKLSSTEHHILDLGTYTMTAKTGTGALGFLSNKDAIEIVNNGRSSAGYALDINADATNPGGITTATSKAVVKTTGKSGVQDRPIIRFYNGVFNAGYIVSHSGSNGTNCPQFWFYGGEFNGTISTNRSLNQFYGGTFNGQLWMSVDSSAYTLIAGGTFSNLSNNQGSTLNSAKFTIGSAKGVYDKEVYIDDNGNYVIAAAEPAEGIEADVAKTPGTNDYLAYSKVATEGKLNYTDVKVALEKNNSTSAEVTVYVEELDMTGINFKGTIVVPEGNDITITNAPSTLKVELADGTVLTPDENGTVATKLKVATLAELQAALAAENELPIIITETIVIPEGETVVLDLNGKTVTRQDEANQYALRNLGDLTIKDTKGNGSINARGIYNGYGDGGANVATAKITVVNGTINAKGTNGGGAIFNYGTANVNGGTFTSIGGYSLNNQAGASMTIADGVTANNGIYASGATLVVNGGEISGNRSGCHVLYAWNSTVTINGGEFYNNNSGNSTTMAAGTTELTITGGTFGIKDGRVPGNGNTWTSCLTDTQNSATMTVNGGTFNGGFRVQGGTTMTINGGSFNDCCGSGYNIYGTAVVKGGTFTDAAAKNFAKSKLAEGYELNADGTVTAIPVAEVNGTKYTSIEDALAAATAGSEIKLLANIEGDITVPANVTLNGNGFAVSGAITAAGEITFAGVTKTGNFGVENTNTVVNIPDGASLQLTGTGRMVIGHGCTFNITGTIADAKNANVADVTPSLVMPGASFTGAGVTFNVTNAYISAPSSYCSSSKSASGTFDFNITNSIWENAGKLAFESQSTAATVNFDLVESVLNTGSHLVFGVSRGEIVVDNSNVNVGKSNQIENQSTMTIKNGSVVNGAVATSSNAKNPGTVIVENATYAVTGEFSGSNLGTGTLIIKKGATVSAGSITKANITIDATDMAAGDAINLTANLSNLAGELSVINNDDLEAKIVDGKIVLALKPEAMIGETPYETLAAAFAAAQNGDVIIINRNVTSFPVINKAVTFKGGKENAAVEINYALSQNFTAIDGTVRFENLTFNKPLFTEHGGTKPNLTIEFEGCNFNVNSEAGYGILIGTSWSNSVVKGLKVNNCNFKYVGDVFKGGYMLYVQCVNEVTITNNTIDGNNLYRGAIHLGDATEHATVAIVSNNTIKNFCRGVMMGNRKAPSSATISSNTFDNIKYSDKDEKPAQECAPIFIHGNATAEALHIVLTNNAITNCTNRMIYSDDTDLVADYVTEFTANTVNGTAVEFADSYNAPKQLPVVAKIGDKGYQSLQAAINKVQNNQTITLVRDVTENVTLTEKVGLYYTIDGAINRANNTMNGKIVITPLSDENDNRRITIKNINFVNTADAAVDFISCAVTNHYPRLTVEGCTFTGNGKNTDVALRLKTAYGAVIKDCTGTGLHSFLQNTAGRNFAIEKVTVTNSKSGLSLGTVQGVTIKGSNIDVAGYGIRMDANTYNNNAVIESNTIKAFIPVVVRNVNTASNITFQGTNTFTATNTDGLWCAIGTSEYGENGQMPTAATGNVSVTLNDAGLNADGIYGNSINFEGSGTEESPYLINNLNDLKFFRNNVDKQAQDGSTQYAGKYFKLTADIDLAGINWNPIGSMSGDHGSFKGVFDGDNHTISNLKVEQAGDGIGLFARTTGNAVIKNLILNNVTVKSTSNSNHVGGVVGNAFASTKIKNVHVTGDVQISGRGYIGGIVGHGYVVMDNVSVVANEGSLITSTFWCAGGILGYAGEGTTNIMNARVEGLTITSAAGGLGSIVGMAEDNEGTQPISGSDLSAENVDIKTYVGAYGTAYENYCIGYLYGGNKTSKLTGELKVENVVLENASGNFPSEVSDAVANINGKIYFNLASAIATIGNGDVTINLLRDVTLDYNARDEYGNAETTSVTINGNNHTLTLNQKNSDWASIGLVKGKLVLNNMTIEKTGYGDTSGAWNTHAIIFSCPLEMTNVTVNNGIAVQAGATLNNVTINEAGEYYGLWINGNGQTVTMNGGSITATNGGRGIKIADQYIDTPKKVKLNVTGTKFTTAKKAAVLVSSEAGAKITAENVDITNVVADNVNFVWVDEDWAANYGNVEVTGATVAQESIESFVAAISMTQDENTNIIAYYKTLPEAIAAVKEDEEIELINDIKVENKEVIWIEKSLTINGNDKKVTSNANRVFRVNANDVEVTLNNVNMVNYAVRVGQNDIRGISIDPSLTNVELTLNNCSVDFTDPSATDYSYAVNIVGSGTGHTLTVNGGTYEGANVINVWDAAHTVIVKNAVLTSIYYDNDDYYGACIWVSQNQNSSVEATGNTFNGINAVAFNVGYTPVTESNNTDNTGVVAITNGKPYATLEAAFKAATSGCTIDIIKDVTVTEYWDARYTGSKFTVPVTIDGNGKTIKFTNTVYDGGNYMSAFRFEADATVKNLTVDMTEAISGFAGRFRAISAKANLTVDGCTFIGNGSANNTRAIIFGEGAGANAGNLAISITNSNFEGWKRGISDNENAQDVKTVTITDNTLKDAAVYVSAHNNVKFTGNTVEGAYVNIKSYTDNNKLTVTATGNTLTANASGDNVNVNKIDAGGVVVAQEEFIVVPKGDNFNGYTSENSIWGEVWGNAKESFVIKVLDANDNVMGTTSLNNIGGIIDGDVKVTWNLLLNAESNTDEYWTMVWTTAPNINNMPAKVELWVDGVKVSGGNIQLNGPDNLYPIVAAVTDENGYIKSYATSLANAFAYADNNTVVVLRDITLTETATIAAGKEVVLDLNGNTITGRPTVAAAYAVITNKGDLTIENGTIICDHALTGSTAYAVNTIVNSGALTIYGATIENISTASNQIGYAIDNNSTSANAILVVESGRVIVSGSSVYYDGIRQFCNSETNANNVTIKGGEVSSLWMQNPSDNPTGRNTKDVKGSFTIEGGTLNALYIEPSRSFSGLISAGHVASISRFDSTDEQNEERLLAGFITGGTFTMDVNEYCHEYYDAVEGDNGIWTIEQVLFAQTTSLNRGWNWYSSYINLSSEAGLVELQDALDGKGIEIKGKTGFSGYQKIGEIDGVDQFKWYNTEDFIISAKQMYMIKTKEAVEIMVDGVKMNPETTLISLRPGWNWIGYPVAENLSINVALAGLVAEDGDVIKSRGGESEYIEGYGWIGDLLTMEPGVGYMYYSQVKNSFRYSMNTRGEKYSNENITADNNHWVPEASQYANNMSIVAMLNIEGETMMGNYEIAAFVDGECRGSARPVYIEALDSYVVFMTVFGEEAEELTFKYYDINNETESELKDVLTYSSDTRIGSARNPYMFYMNTLNIEESTLDMINIYPNPTTTDRAINLQATCDNVEVFNALGVKVAEYQNVDSIDALETAGVYVIRVTINGETRNCRLVVK